MYIILYFLILSSAKYCFVENLLNSGVMAASEYEVGNTIISLGEIVFAVQFSTRC